MKREHEDPNKGRCMCCPIPGGGEGEERVGEGERERLMHSRGNSIHNTVGISAQRQNKEKYASVKPRIEGVSKSTLHLSSMQKMGSGDDNFSCVSTQVKAESGDDRLSHVPSQVEKIYCMTDWRAVPDVWKEMWRPRTGPGVKGPGETPCGPWEAVQWPEKETGFTFQPSWVAWRSCYWCWKWGLGMPILAAVNLPLCSECIHLDEPPWYPNGRKRCQIRVETVFRSKELGEGASKTIAAFLTSPVVP